MLIDLIKANRSYRGYNHSHTVTKDELLKMVEAARLCPSSVNIQPLRYFLACDPAIVATIQSHTRWAKGLPDIHLPHPGKEPTAFIVICQDTSIDANLSRFQRDVGIVAQTMLLTAVEMGLGGCMIGNFNAGSLHDAIGLVAHIRPLLIIAIGKPDEEVIVSTFSKSPISLPASEAEHYLASFKKTLGGAVGRNQFTLPVHEEASQLLHQLQSTELKDEVAVTALFNAIREKMEFEGSYLILAMHDAYSVPYKKTDVHTDAPDFTDKVFNYVIVSICPVKLTKPLLTFFSDGRDFHTVEPDLAVGGPVLGFMYPVLDGGSADVNSALYYTKDASDLHADFIDAVFHTTAPEAAADKREQFYGVLGDSLEKGLTFDVVQTIHENLVAQAAEKKKGERLQVGRKEIASLLDSCDVDEKEQNAFEEGYLEQFGADGLDASLIADQKRFEIETENVTINVDSGRSDLVEVKRVDGRRTITIWVEGDITVNGIEVDV